MNSIRLGLVLAIGLGGLSPLSAAAVEKDKRPNIFFAIADDWGWPDAGIYGNPVIQTPTFDRVAREGVLFANAFISAPSCTSSRSAIMTGQYHWRLEEAANLWSTLQAKFQTYPQMLERAGYQIGKMRKAWGPGRLGPGGRTRDPAGPNYKNFAAFLKARDPGKPFCFWFGSSDPHRPYRWRSGVESGMDLKRIKLPACFPDREVIRTDLADYYWEVQRFDREVGEALALLETNGALDNTIVVITGDHGMPFPRGKSNLYDLGTRVPLAVRWPARVKGGRSVDDFVSLTDLAPTFLEAAGLKPIEVMTGRSFLNVLTSTQSGWVDRGRDHVLFGKERHVPSQERGNPSGYPSRGLRTRDYLYLRNFRPELWPNGVSNPEEAYIGNSFADCDNGPTKTYLMDHRDEAGVKVYFDLAFAKRPAEELYDLKRDPDQLHNVAAEAAYAEVRKKLAAQLMSELEATRDPRVVGGAEKFDQYPYYGGKQKPRAP
jgi:N-sulfoglucosamine sulfohydrolase